MKQQFLDLTGLTELVAYIESNVTDKKEILPYASNKLFPSTGDVNAIYIDTATNTIYRWDTSSKTYIILAKAVKSVSISESTENGKITLTVDGVKTTVPIHGLGSAAYTNSNAYSPADHTHTKAQIGLGSVDNTADKDKSVKHANTADSATTAGTATTATNVNGENATVDAARHVWFSDSATETKRNYNDKFKYNPATNTVTANISGSAASANSVLWSGVTNKPSTFTPSSHNHDDSTITSLNASKLFGTIDIARLPQGALERLVIVADDTARFKLTTANVQLGDTVKVIKTEKMYYVVDESKLSSEAGYSVYTAGTATSVPWSGVTGKPSSYPPASHNHDERYYTETEMNSKLAEKAPKVHTHVKSEVGLGNVDNTADANKSVKYAASAGTASSCTGNAATATTATKLATARSINGTNFDGSGNITTASWGTARNVTIGNTKKSVNGASDVAWSLSEIGAAAASHSHSYLPLSGGTMTGNISYKGSKATYEMIKFIDNVVDVNGNGIAIGGGGLTIVGGGESSDIVKTIASSGGDERLILSNDSAIDIYTNCQNGLSKATHVTIDNSGLYSGTAAKANSVPWSGVTGKPSTYTPSSHTHNYAGSGSAGGIAYNANALYVNPSARQASANYDLTNSAYYAYRVTYSIASSSMTTGKPPSDAHILTFGWDTTAGWGAQIAIGDAQSNHLYIRGANSETKDNKNVSTWESSWRTVLDSSNYTSYVPTKTGGGASGTWGISISGNANSSNYLKIVANNEIRFVKPSSALSLYIGYAWSDGTKSKMINEYKFYGGDGNLTQVTASQFNGSLSGNASSATALTSNAGSATQPVYFSGGKPVACSYTLGKSVPSNAVFTDTNTWRGIQNNLTSDSTSDSLSAAQGKALKALVDGKAASSHSHNKVSGAYTGNGGQQKPNYFGTNQVGFLMMNTAVNNNTHYKDWIIMDCYSGTDVGGAVAFGVNRQSLGAYIMRSESGRTSWAESAELLHTSNYTSYTVTKTGSGASGTWGINVSGGAAYPTGFHSRATSTSWGNQTGTLITDWHTSNGGDIQFRDNSGQLNVIIDGLFYQNEGRNLVLDSVNYSNYAATKGHTHNYAGSSSAGGNANAAVKLATARSINGTSFNGSANITTANWGTARTITVGNTGKSVNGSGNVSWSLGEIGIHVSNKEPAASEGKNGDVWIVYEG